MAKGKRQQLTGDGQGSEGDVLGHGSQEPASRWLHTTTPFFESMSQVYNSEAVVVSQEAGHFVRITSIATVSTQIADPNPRSPFPNCDVYCAVKLNPHHPKPCGTVT